MKKLSTLLGLAIAPVAAAVIDRALSVIKQPTLKQTEHPIDAMYQHVLSINPSVAIIIGANDTTRIARGSELNLATAMSLLGATLADLYNEQPQENKDQLSADAFIRIASDIIKQGIK